MHKYQKHMSIHLPVTKFMTTYLKRQMSSQLVWLSGLSASLRIKGSPVPFPVRAHAWVVGQVPNRGHTRGNHTLCFSHCLSPFPPLCLIQDPENLLLCFLLRFLQFSFFLRLFTYHYFYFQRKRKGGRKRGKHQCVVASRTTPAGDLACNPGMCPDWESNWRPFGSQVGSQSTEPHQSGLYHTII